jgi:hypothetical protein
MSPNAGVRLIQVRQIEEAAEQHLGFIVPVFYLAFWVVAIAGVEWLNCCEIQIDGSDVIGDDVHHDQHSTRVRSLYEIEKVLARSKASIQLKQSPHPKTMIPENK